MLTEIVYFDSIIARPFSYNYIMYIFIYGIMIHFDVRVRKIISILSILLIKYQLHQFISGTALMKVIIV